MTPIELEVAGKANLISHGDRNQNNTKAGTVTHSHFSAGGPPQAAWQKIRSLIVANEASKSEERIPFKYWVILMQRARKDVSEDKAKH
jgi:hypothetical protein